MSVEADEDVLAALRPLLVRGAYPMAPTRRMAYSARRDPAGVTVAEEGDRLGSVATAGAAADAIYVRLHRRAFELASLAGWVRVHAVTVDVGPRRVLVVGEAGAGKTTLALQLLADGHVVHGDESVLIRRGSSLAVPRPFHLKDGAATLVPRLARSIAAMPRIDDVTIFDPTTVAPCHLTMAPVDDVVLLDRGAPAHLDHAERVDVLDALAHDAFVVTESRARLLRTLLEAVAAARFHRLGRAEPARMADALAAIG